MDIQMISVPYDSGFKSTRMGRGPGHLLMNGAAWLFTEAGHQVQVQLIEAGENFQTEIRSAFVLNRLVSDRVRAARTQGVFPLVLSGNCGSALGAVSGLGAEGLGLIWLDAHGDFNTPETTTSGFLDGMALATITGRCWRTLAGSIPGFSPLPDDRVIHIGSRQLDALEQDLLNQSRVCVISAERMRIEGAQGALAEALADLRGRVREVYLHIDLDVLDPDAAPANRFSPPGGLSVAQVLEVIGRLRASFPIVSGGIASYDPEGDRDGRALRAGFRLMECMVTGSGC
jgi:arginase